jgi:hypothetical protein
MRVARIGDVSCLAAHEAGQKAVSDWPALKAALQLLGQARLMLLDDRWSDGGRIVALDGMALGYGGVQLGSGPRAAKARRQQDA